MSFYQLNKAKLFKKAHDKYPNKGGKEKAALYYQKDKETIKKKRKKKVLINDRYRKK